MTSMVVTVAAAAKGLPFQQIRVCQSMQMSFLLNIRSSPPPAAAARKRRSISKIENYMTWATTA